MLTSKEMEEKSEVYGEMVTYTKEDWEDRGIDWEHVNTYKERRDFWLAQAAIKAEQEETNRILRDIRKAVDPGGWE